ncbi:MAG: cupin domain-containing protein [Acholeplasmataceae bacterium]
MKNIEFSKNIHLKDEINYQPGTVVSKTLYQTKSVSITLFAFDKGEGLTPHASRGDALVTVLDGEVIVDIDGQESLVKTGESILMPRNIPHGLQAIKAFKMLLIITFE